MTPVHGTDETEARGPVTVLCAVVGPVEAVSVAALATVPDAVDLTRRCADIAELLAASAAGLGRVAVVSCDLPGLDRPVVAALHADGTRVLALCPDVPWQRERVQALGVDAVCEDADVPAKLVELVRSAAVSGAGALAAVGHPDGAAPGTADPRAAWEWETGAGDGWGAGTGTRDGAAGLGIVVAVWGPTGAPGRSTIALNLAAELVADPARGRRDRGDRRDRRERRRRQGRTPSGWANGPAADPWTDLAQAPDVPGQPSSSPAPAADTALLVDADTYSGALAQMTGLLDESSGIAAACRAAGNGTLTLHQLATITPALTPRLRILTGIARASRWPELSAAGLETVWQECRRLARWTVIDCGFAVESDEMLTYDTRAPQRNAATLSALAAADVVVVVGGADAVSMQRLVRALDDLRGTGVATNEPVVVVNRVRASAVGRQAGTVLRETLLRYANVTDVQLVPEDQASCDAALLAGRALGEVAPASAARRAISELAEAVRERAPAGHPAAHGRGAEPAAGSPVASAWSPTVAH